MQFLDTFLFISLPYIAIVVFLVGTIYRYKSTSFKYSSLSSGFLEKRTLFWGSMPFHWGILVLFIGHLLAFLVPGAVLAWNGDPVRLLIQEMTAFAFGLSVLWGLSMLTFRRFSSPRIRSVTNPMDAVILTLLIAQTLLGLWTAYNYRWGSSWFASTATPYLRSILVFQPDPAAIYSLPWSIKLHIVGGYLIVLLIPFTRLVHLLVVPFHYLWRPYQRVIWNWKRRAVRDQHTDWTTTRPKNT
ncbi:MAG: respiratory nitrate reductase subunit gamma [Rhodothermia bacterium]|nr:MAG: respiratory nitrate reductase subunit gamma [Rhodothermia bacterium]